MISRAQVSVQNRLGTYNRAARVRKCKNRSEILVAKDGARPSMVFGCGRKMKLLVIAWFWVCVGLCAASGEPSKLTVTSAAFESGQPIPVKYSCQADDTSPPLKWEGAPASTKSFALICDDPDAPGGTWVHWVIYNQPPDAPALPENTAKSETLPNGAAQGRNSFGNIGYGGPCPPGGKAHRYFFKVYALDVALTLKEHPDNERLLASMKGHIVAQGQLMGTYQRR
jgi:Raf kinase inhibitor-like YbhB/YbcL family protein